MKREEFIDMCKRMVVEYYNRYVHMVDNPTIDTDKVFIVELVDGSDYITEVLLQVDIDPWLQYKVIKSGKDNIKIESYTIFT